MFFVLRQIGKAVAVKILPVKEEAEIHRLFVKHVKLIRRPLARHFQAVTLIELRILACIGAHDERIEFTQRRIGVCLQILFLLLRLARILEEDIGKQADAADDRLFPAVIFQIMADIHGNGKQNARSGAADQSRDDHDAHGLLHVVRIEALQLIDRSVQFGDSSLTQAGVKRQAGDGTDLSRALRQRLVVQLRIDGKPIFARLVVGVERLSDRHALRGLNREQAVDRMAQFPQFVRVRIERHKADKFLLRIIGELADAANDVAARSAKADDERQRQLSFEFLFFHKYTLLYMILYKVHFIVYQNEDTTSRPDGKSRCCPDQWRCCLFFD